MQAPSEETSCNGETGRRYLYTIFNWPGQPGEFIENIWQTEEVNFVVGQLERGAVTNREHIQLYVEWKQPVRGARIKRLMGLSDGWGWFIKCRGPATKCEDYCSKEETRVEGPWRHGNRGAGQGARSDLAVVAEKLANGSSLSTIAKEHPTTYIKYNKGLAALARELYPPTGEYKKKVVWVRYGTTGMGKTRWAYTQYPQLFRVPPLQKQAVWFDGYVNQEVVLFDDYGLQNKLPWEMLLHITDGYDLQVPVKGGFVVWRPQIVIFTSNAHWYDWYPEVLVKDPFERRITQCVAHTEEWKPVDSDTESEEFHTDDE